ncbi:MAG: hypothetical protein GQ532_05960 [Methylomarinum sp.]|nr:hypothetical protein [Methylomarinum sp.]
MDQIIPCEFNNQRKHTRFIRDDIKASVLPVNFLGLKETIACKLIDICSAGLQLSTKEKFRTNTTLLLTLQFDNGREFKLKAKILRHTQKTIYLSNHHFNISKDTLKNKNNPLHSVHLFESDNKIEAKYRFLNINCIRALTFSPLDSKKQYQLAFTLKNKKTIITNSKFKHYQHYIQYDYGLKFDSINDELGDYLLNTQTDLVFK